MLIFDQLKKNDPQLRLLTLGICAGIAVLIVGLWWVQIVSAREYRQDLVTQSFRTVRIPAARGKILDRNGVPLAENRPVYNVSLYLEDLRKQFDQVYAAEVGRQKDYLAHLMTAQEKKLGRSLTKQEKKQFTLSLAQRGRIRQQTRYLVASNTVMAVGGLLRQPLALDFNKFTNHYQKQLPLPYPVASNLDSTNIARFEEQSAGFTGVDLEIQSLRVYPYQTTAAHLLGFVRKNNDSIEGEESFYSYRLPDYRGIVGIEGGHDLELHGRAGEKSVLVNSLGYRQTENIWTPAEPGKDVVLTIDVQIQQAAETALRRLGPQGTDTRGAAVVMDVRTGDILAMASSPTFDPNDYIKGITPPELAWLNDPRLRPQINRAMQENYAPGSIFKTVVAMACLENGLDPKAIYTVQENPRRRGYGVYYLGNRDIRDTAPSGPYDFRRALIRSSNSYFIEHGLRVGVDKIAVYGRRLHLGESIGLSTRQEAKGIFPTDRRTHSGWSDGDTANLCIGQGYIAVTPLQMTVMAAALANGGLVLYPRLVDRIQTQDPLSGEPPTVFPTRRVRDNLGLKPSTLAIINKAMLDDVEDQVEGTGKEAYIPGFRICSKTGTAEVANQRNEIVDQTTWFLSFAPYENPRYAVVVMVESGSSGGGTCAPIAREIYLSILKIEKARAVRSVAGAR